ncbi:hypothetical protein ABZS66_12015 [Dactylosporangium sp. NPDC005572]|uniref:hypothetical protein n=1 Tax=Dactylosporangium sp. NPDC005572 TaxID=3156889 RepID=UPI0033A028C8
MERVWEGLVTRHGYAAAIVADVVAAGGVRPWVRLIGLGSMLAAGLLCFVLLTWWRRSR